MLDNVVTRGDLRQLKSVSAVGGKQQLSSKGNGNKMYAYTQHEEESGEFYGTLTKEGLEDLTLG